MIINSVEVPDLDFLDVDTMERFEAMLEIIQKISFPDGAKESEKIRIQCTTFWNCINELFEGDIAETIFHSKYNIRTCLTAMRDLTNEVKAQTKSMSDLIPQTFQEIDVNRKGIKLVTHEKSRPKFANLAR